MIDPPSVDVVILVSRGDRANIVACLASYERYPSRKHPASIHVVDNASDDGTVDAVRDQFPWANITLVGRNAGFAVANNIALRTGRAPYALVLNPDTEFHEGTLDHMLLVMERQVDIGVAGCRLVRPDGTFDHAAKRSFPTVLGALGHFSGFGRRDGAGESLSQYRAPDVEETGQGEVDAVNGAFMLVRRSAFAGVGLFDEGYWIYGEDLDWCYRFKLNGWKVWYDGTVSMIHRKAGTTGSYRRLRQNAAFHHAMARFYRKFYAGRRPVVDALVFFGISLKFVLSAARSSLVRTARAARAAIS